MIMQNNKSVVRNSSLSTPGDTNEAQGKTRPRLHEIAAAFTNPKFSIWIDLFLILAVGTFTLLLHYQGWRSEELVNLDMLPYYSGTRDFLATGKSPEPGEI